MAAKAVAPDPLRRASSWIGVAAPVQAEREFLSLLAPTTRREFVGGTRLSDVLENHGGFGALVAPYRRGCPVAGDRDQVATKSDEKDGESRR
jgi:hypothetical protein